MKEEVLTRLGELGVEVRAGLLEFRPRLLARREFLDAPGALRWVHPDGTEEARALKAGELGFTVCQVPVIYRLAAEPSHTVRWASGAEDARSGSTLDEAASRAILVRTGAVREVEVAVVAAELLDAAAA